MTFDQGEYLHKNPKDVMAKHGKTFYWASHLFSKKRFEDIALLYTFCRYVDDTADEGLATEAKRALIKLRQDMKHPQHKFLQQVDACFRRQGIDPQFAEQLINGAEFDVDGGKIHSKRDLLIYCYQVAGVVGLMMCPLLGVTGHGARPYALDLGIGMQLTNICRDVLEDARNSRCYLPSQDLEDLGISLEDLEKQGPASKALKAYVKDLLQLADGYYRSGFEGLNYIPLRPRLAILVAGRLYQAIGHKILRNHCQVLQGRTYLNHWEKIWVSLQAIGDLWGRSFWQSRPHKQDLHRHLAGLPGV